MQINKKWQISVRMSEICAKSTMCSIGYNNTISLANFGLFENFNGLDIQIGIFDSN